MGDRSARRAADGHVQVGGILPEGMILAVKITMASMVLFLVVKIAVMRPRGTRAPLSVHYTQMQQFQPVSYVSNQAYRVRDTSIPNRYHPKSHADP